MGRGAGRKIVQNAIFHGKRHDNKFLKVQILLSRNYVVMAQAPRIVSKNSGDFLAKFGENSGTISGAVFVSQLIRNRKNPFWGNPVFRIRCLVFYIGGHDREQFAGLRCGFLWRADTGSAKPSSRRDMKLGREAT